MIVKIDTKEKFHAITVLTPQLSASLTEEMKRGLVPLLEQDVKNVVLKMGAVNSIDEAAGETLAQVQQLFYERSASFVICELQPEVEATLDKLEILELMNVTPTESEAWDIVQMEEIERELMDGEDF
jgi:anti-anti-sigma factor